MERQDIRSTASRSERIVGPSLEPRMDRADGFAAPHHVYKGVYLERATERAGVEERNGVCLSGDRAEWLSGSEDTCPRICSVRRSQQGNTVS